jgi:hypothetical protein
LRLSSGGIDRLSDLFTTQGDSTFRRDSVLIIIAGVYFLILDGITLAWAGAWCGLASRVQQARSNTMALVLVVPFLCFIGFIPALAQSATIRAFFHDAGFNIPFVLAVAFVTACDITIICVARRWLFEKARQRLTDPQPQSRGQSFFVFSKPKLDNKAPLNLGNVTKAL